MRSDAAPTDVAQAAPAYANAALLAAAAAAAAALLAFASGDAPFPARLAAAGGFAFLGNTLFSLMHEAVHGNFSRLPWLNALGGRVAAVFFPTSFTMQKAFHLTHHRNNRSEAERFDYVGPADNVLLKSAQWYTILTGLYWASAPLFVAVFSLLGGVAPLRRALARRDDFARQTSAEPYFGAALSLPLGRVRLDAATTLLGQLALVHVAGATWAGWALCYALFGLMWSSLQYADHAFSRLDREEGAWNLRVGALTRALFLNYHFHLSHHRDPGVAWFRLPRQARPADADAAYVDLLLLMWGGPRLLPGASQPESRGRWLETCSKLMQGAAVAFAFAVVYAAADVAHARASVFHDVRTPLDGAAPFWPGAAWVYLTIAPLMASVLVCVPTSRALTPYTMAFLAQIFVAGVVFVSFPVAPMPADLLGPGADAFGMRIARSVALAGNFLPSLHVAFALSAAAVCARFARGRAVAAGFWLWALTVVASTVLTRQHYLLDVAAGAALAATAMTLAPGAVARRMDAAQARLTAAAAAPA